MEVAIAGGHGQVARRLTRRLVTRGDKVRALIRNPQQESDIRADSAEPVICDLEQASADEVAAAIAGVDAVVFAAGAGPGSGAERKWSMDRDGATKLLAAAQSASVARYVMVSSVGAENPPDGDDVFSIYLRAKAEADRALMKSDRDWTIVRPGRLTDEPGTERVRLDVEAARAEISRDDVAAVLAAVLHEPRSVHLVLYAIGGEDPVEEALGAALEL
jgi:uncharacterized protein YbjT (DUF2867 family)